MKYKLILNENQMRAVKDACELRFRIDLLQDYDLSDILAKIDLDENSFGEDNPRRDRNFDEYIDRRDHIMAVVKALFEIASPYARRVTIGRKRNKDSLIVEDVYQSIRYALWEDDPDHDYRTVDSRKPMQCSSEPLPTVERED